MSTTNGHKHGFRLPVQEARLVFEGDYAGLIVACRLNVSLQTYLDFASLADMPDEMESAEDFTKLGGYFERFSQEILLGWNAETPEGEPIPVKPDGMVRLDPALSGVILAKWLEAVRLHGPLAATGSSSSTRSASGGTRSRVRSSRSRQTS